MCKSLVLCFLGTLLITVSIAFKIDTEFSNDGDRIVGGSEAEPGQYPHQVSLRTGVQVRHHICGGSIISDRWVITAAHCVSTVVANLVIVAGAHHISEDGVTYKLNQSIVHENYNRSSLENDIALLQTTRPISFSENVLPVALSNKHVDGGVRAVVSGWGRLVAVSVFFFKLCTWWCQKFGFFSCIFNKQIKSKELGVLTTACTSFVSALDHTKKNKFETQFKARLTLFFFCF